MLEVEGQEVGRGEGPPSIGVREDDVAARGKLLDSMQSSRGVLPVVIVNMYRLNNAVHGDGRRLVQALSKPWSWELQLERHPTTTRHAMTELNVN